MSNQPEISAIVINLENATARWKFQQHQLKCLGIKHERFDATTANDLTPDEYEKWANDWQRKLRKTEVACFLSHYRVWQKVSNANQTYLILEDDALLSDQLPLALKQLARYENIYYDHLSFETRGRKKLISKESVFESTTLSLHRIFLDKTGAAAYLLTPIGARKLVNEVLLKGAGLADALLCHTKTLNKLQSVPALAFQMDMAAHYGMPYLKLESIAKSNICTEDNKKPTPNGISDKLSFKRQRLAAQIDMGLVQARHSIHSAYLEIHPNKDHYAYIKSLLN